MAVTERGIGGIDLRKYHDFVKGLKTFDPTLRKELQKRLRASGEIVATEARARAIPYSHKTPPTIKVRVSGASIMVVAGGREAQIAGLLELGNKGGRKSINAIRKGKFRHPVFGDRSNWVEQEMHPYLGPAARATRRQVRNEVKTALKDASKAATRG